LQLVPREEYLSGYEITKKYFSEREDVELLVEKGIKEIAADFNTK